MVLQHTFGDAGESSSLERRSLVVRARSDGDLDRVLRLKRKAMVSPDLNWLVPVAQSYEVVQIWQYGNLDSTSHQDSP